MLRIGAPILAASTVWLAGKALQSGYAAATGAPPPKPDDLDVPVIRIVLFAVATATVTALIRVGIERGAAKAIARNQGPVPV